jgi:hypothetical protein
MGKGVIIRRGSESMVEGRWATVKERELSCTWREDGSGLFLGPLLGHGSDAGKFGWVRRDGTDRGCFLS